MSRHYRLVDMTLALRPEQAVPTSTADERFDFGLLPLTLDSRASCTSEVRYCEAFGVTVVYVMGGEDVPYDHVATWSGTERLISWVRLSL